jgi:hypothetical protein
MTSGWISDCTCRCRLSNWGVGTAFRNAGARGPRKNPTDSSSSGIPLATASAGVSATVSRTGSPSRNSASVMCGRLPVSQRPGEGTPRRSSSAHIQRTVRSASSSRYSTTAYGTTPPRVLDLWYHKSPG